MHVHARHAHAHVHRYTQASECTQHDPPGMMMRCYPRTIFSRPLLQQCTGTSMQMYAGHQHCRAANLLTSAHAGQRRGCAADPPTLHTPTINTLTCMYLCS
eukprot:1161508-Pelagomonas_calceolata.AAC.4